MRQIVLDTETTGLDPKDGHRVIEVGCIELIKRRFTGNNFHSYINPEREVEAGALKVHGITNTFLLNKPTFAEIYPQLREYLDGAELIIHNAPFDLGFLNHEFKLIHSKNSTVESKCKIVDTLVMARKMHPGQRNSLDALIKRYQVESKNRKLHGALLDAEILAHVYLAMTGGQKTLFDLQPMSDNADISETSAIVENKLTKKQWDLPVVLASEAEIAADGEYFK